MDIAIWIVIAAVVALAAGYVAAMAVSRRNASSRANQIMDEARREADVLKEARILKAKEETMKIIASQRLQKVQAAEARAKQREMQLNQQQGEQNRRKKELEGLKNSLDNREQLLESKSAEVGS